MGGRGSNRGACPTMDISKNVPGSFQTLGCLFKHGEQISAMRGTDSRFVLEANLKSLYPRSSQSSNLKTQNRDQSKHEYKPSSNPLEYQNTDSYNELFFPNYEFIRVCIQILPKDEKSTNCKSRFLKFRLE